MGFETGRTARKEENTKGSGEEEDYIHEAVRERYDDGWEEEGMMIYALFGCEVSRARAMADVVDLNR